MNWNAQELCDHVWSDPSRGAPACHCVKCFAPKVVHHDTVNHPKHYVSHPSGIECIQVTEFMGFNLGNAVKYVWRADLKNDALEDLRKAVWYIQREIEKRGKTISPQSEGE